MHHLTNSFYFSRVPRLIGGLLCRSVFHEILVSPWWSMNVLMKLKDVWKSTEKIDLYLRNDKGLKVQEKKRQSLRRSLNQRSMWHRSLRRSTDVCLCQSRKHTVQHWSLNQRSMTLISTSINWFSICQSWKHTAQRWSLHSSLNQRSMWHQSLRRLINVSLAQNWKHNVQRQSLKERTSIDWHDVDL